MYVCMYIVHLFMYTYTYSNQQCYVFTCLCCVHIQMEEINIPMVKGSMDDIGDEEVNFSPTAVHVQMLLTDQLVIIVTDSWLYICM